MNDYGKQEKEKNSVTILLNTKKDKKLTNITLQFTGTN